ncbi:transposase [Flavobacterium sp.]|uniref:transposase n=1 Tax=Flavobacterium sp. TaxID=239 RepID=UPI00375073C7
MTNIYSSRKIEQALRENINFKWLFSMTIVDHNTVNCFRSNKLQDTFKKIFKQVVLLFLFQENYQCQISHNLFAIY